MRRPAGGDRNNGVGTLEGTGSIGTSGAGGRNKRGGGDKSNAARRRGGGPSFTTTNTSCSSSTMWLVLVLHSLLIGAQFVLLAIILYYGASNVLFPSSDVSSPNRQTAIGEELMLTPFNSKILTRSGQFHQLTKDGSDGGVPDLETLRKNYNNLRQRMDQIERQLGGLSNGNLQAKNGNNEIEEKLKELADIEKNSAAASATGGKKNLVFLHIGKSGGTSFDITGKKLANDVQMTYIGKKHFDWSFILNTVAGGTTMTPSSSNSIANANQAQHKLRENDQCQVITILREPVDRAISHYHFTKKQKWGGAIKAETLSQFLFNTSKQHLLDTRDIWQDGQAAVSWLTGTHIASWAQITKDEVPQRELIASNYTKMCLLAAERLEQTRWFGLLDDIDRSLELLQWEFSLEQKPEMKKQNQNKARLSHPTNDDVTQHEKDALASLMPQDIWLYGYAKLLFAARWNEYQTGIYIQPDKPPLPTEWPCRSTRFTLNCTSGPLVDVYENS